MCFFPLFGNSVREVTPWGPVHDLLVHFFALASSTIKVYESFSLHDDHSL